MPYSKGAAYKSFIVRVDDLRRVVGAADRLKVGGKYNQTYRDAMLSSSILLSFAYFESYVADVTNDVCKALCSPGLMAKSLAGDLRAHVSVSSKLNSWIGIQDPLKQRQQILAFKAADGFELLADEYSPTGIDVGSLLSGVGYPKPDNIRKLLSRFGVPDPLAALKGAGGHSVMQKLTSIHDARAELAHTGRLPAWTISDYKDRLTDIGHFARAVDYVLWRYVCSTVPSSRWIR